MDNRFVCELSFKVVILFTVAVQLSEADKFEKCLKQTELHVLPNNTFRCEDEVIQLCFKYGEKQCCKPKSDCAADFQKCLDDIYIRCKGKQSCTLPKPKENSDDSDKEEECDFRTEPVIEYTCTEDGKALPPTCSSSSTGDREETTMVIIPIIAVLAALIIAAVILGVVLYRRRSRKKRKNNSSPKPDERNKGEDNAGLEDEYNTIPADYEETPQNSYQALDETKADTEHAYSNKGRRNNSMMYSTIVLPEDTETKRNAHGYDRTNPKISYEANELKDLESMHSYGHFSDTPDDYSKVNTNYNKHNPDKDYSHFESEPSSDYSHLHDQEKALHRKPSNDYNHLQTRAIPNRPTKRADSYEQPVLKDINDVLVSEPHAKTGENETSVDIPTNIARNEKIKRKDSYEEPVFISTSGMNDVSNYETKVNIKIRDDYETPVKFKDASIDNNDVSIYTPVTVKRKDSYEIPVLKNTGVFNSKQNVVSKTTDNYEAPLSLRNSENVPQNAEDKIPINKQFRRNDSYETPILKTQ